MLEHPASENAAIIVRAQKVDFFKTKLTTPPKTPKIWVTLQQELQEIIGLAVNEIPLRL